MTATIAHSTISILNGTVFLLLNQAHKEILNLILSANSRSVLLLVGFIHALYMFTMMLTVTAIFHFNTLFLSHSNKKQNLV